MVSWRSSRAMTIGTNFCWLVQKTKCFFKMKKDNDYRVKWNIIRSRKADKRIKKKNIYKSLKRIRIMYFFNRNNLFISTKWTIRNRLFLSYHVFFLFYHLPFSLFFYNINLFILFLFYFSFLFTPTPKNDVLSHHYPKKNIPVWEILHILKSILFIILSLNNYAETTLQLDDPHDVILRHQNPFWI